MLVIPTMVVGVAEWVVVRKAERWSEPTTAYIPVQCVNTAIFSGLCNLECESATSGWSMQPLAESRNYSGSTFEHWSVATHVLYHPSHICRLHFWTCSVLYHNLSSRKHFTAGVNQSSNMASLSYTIYTLSPPWNKAPPLLGGEVLIQGCYPVYALPLPVQYALPMHDSWRPCFVPTWGQCTATHGTATWVVSSGNELSLKCIRYGTVAVISF